MEKEKSVIRSLMDVQIEEPETMDVSVPRLDLVLTLREIPYDKVVRLRGTDEADLHYLLASIQSHELKDAMWYREKMGCPTPADALKRLLRPGEIAHLVRMCDTLNGYGSGSVVSVQRSEQELQSAAIGEVLDELEKN
ncbi:MAG TPA: hypothetical protein H9764_01690 [Candidatus Flavonifractor merdavium]|nr:hypothetical protein [Candidatus Flavonifractor merdavium]